MDDAALRTLATRLRAELDPAGSDPAGSDPADRDSAGSDPADRARILAELDAALGSDPLDRDALLDVVNRHAATRRWFAANAPVTEDVDRSFDLLAGDAEGVGIYYVCPEGDKDVVLDSRPERPPRCSRHGVEMISED